MPPKIHQLTFRQLHGIFAVCRLPADSPVPPWALHGAFFSVTKTADELSIVCLQANVPEHTSAELNWAALKLEGPFPFAMTGILSSFIAPLSASGIPIFAISTFDTDYVFVKQEILTTALEKLSAAGHQFLPARP